MRVTINELMDKLGVGFTPGPNDNVPWVHTDTNLALTFSAEIRMGMESEEVEGEIQILYDRPPPGKGSMEHICFLRAAPIHEGMWTMTDFRFRGAPYGREIYDWEEKACLFFQTMIREIQAGVSPNVDQLLDDAFHKRERFADQRGSGGGKAPKIKPGKLLSPKGGGKGF